MTGSVQRLLRFGIVGLSNTLLGLGVIYVCWRFLGMGDVPANMTGYVVGLLWGYTWNRRWTFRSARPARQQFGRYLLLCLCAYAANLGVIGIARHVLGDQSFFPHVAGTVFYTALTYLGCRHFVFAESSEAG
jgi:putative flippase GtrA